MNIAYNIDCMEYLKTVPDKFFELAVVDPPYGGGAERERERPTGRRRRMGNKRTLKVRREV